MPSDGLMPASEILRHLRTHSPSNSENQKNYKANRGSFNNSD